MSAHKSENQAAREGELYRLLAENIQDYAIFVVDTQGRIQHWTPGAGRLLQWREDEIVGQPVSRLFTPEDVADGAPEHELQQALESGRGEDDRWHVRKDGSRFWSSGMVRPLWDDAQRLRGFAKIMRDRTEWRTSEDRFRGLMEQAPMSIQIFSPTGQTLRVNRAWEELWGVSADQAENYNILEDPQLEAAGALALIRRAFAGETVAIPAIHYDPNETLPHLTRYRDARRWVSAVAYPLRDPTGNVREVVLVHEDITARKRAEDAFRDSEERFRGIASHSIAGLAEVALSGRFLFANQRYCNIVGRSLDQLLQLRMQDISHAADLVENLPLFEQIARDGTPFIIEKRYLRPDGSMVWVNNSVSALRNSEGQIRSVIAVCVDITARRNAEQSLREAHRDLEHRIAQRTAELMRTNQFLMALLESIHDGIVACDAEGSLTLFNRAATEFHGVPQEAIVADDWSEHYDLYRSDGLTPMTKEEIPLFHALHDQRVENVEMVIAPRGDSPRTLLASGQAFFDERGQKLGAVVSMRDITQQKQAEDALRRAHEELEHRVAQRTAELARANDALQEADRHKDEFLAMLAHELRNPLAPIRSGLDLLAISGANEEIVQIMREQVTHVVRLVDDLLDVSRIVRGRIDLRNEPVRLATIINLSVHAVREMIDSRQQQWVLSVPEAPVWLHADPVRLTQVIENLLHNASKYTDTGGRIELMVELGDDEVIIHVRDTGIGMDAQLLPKVFDLFTQSSRTLDRSQGGLGIGLTLVRNLVEMHGGTVSAASEGPGLGSTFTVRLPVAPPPSDLPAMHQGPSISRRHRVLVVDDNVGAAKLLARLVGKLGDHRVELAHDGPSTLAKIEEFRPEIVLLDIGLPGMDGYEVGRVIRSNPEFHEMLLVAVTGYSREQDRRRSQEVGFDEHLAKPPSLDQIRLLLAHPKLSSEGGPG